MIRSSLRNLVIACAVLGPAELSSQAWLTYNGTVDGSFQATCPNNAGTPVPRAGKLRFTFNVGGSDAKTNLVSEWYPTGSPRTSKGGQITADGSASGSGIYLLGGGHIRWEGQFQWASDGSAQGAGSILQAAGDTFGCTGTWSASAAAAGPTTDKTVCAEYGARIQRFWTETARPFERENSTVYSDLRLTRDMLKQISRNIMGIKSMTRPGSLEEQEELRQKTYARIKELDAVFKKIEANHSEMVRLESEGRAAGCSFPGGTPRTGADKAIDELLALDSPPSPPTSPSTSRPAEIMGVAGVKGQVELESQDGTRYSPKDGARIGLNTPITIRTGPGSSVAIQVGSVRKTLQPNTTIRIVTTINGPTYLIEEGAATVDVRKPGAHQIQTPAATANVNGTVFTVSHNATTGVTGVMVEDGRVTVQPKNPGVRGVTLSPGEYVEVGRNAMTAVLPAPGTPERIPSNPQVYPPVTQQNIDLTGLWQDDTGGGAIYRLRQVGNWLYWLVDGTPKGSYVNLSYGQISGNTITGMWVDMPGSPTLSGGNLILRIESNDRLVKVGASGYGAQAWIRVNSAGGNR